MFSIENGTPDLFTTAQTWGFRYVVDEKFQSLGNEKTRNQVRNLNFSFFTISLFLKNVITFFANSRSGLNLQMIRFSVCCCCVITSRDDLNRCFQLCSSSISGIFGIVLRSLVSCEFLVPRADRNSLLEKIKRKKRVLKTALLLAAWRTEGTKRWSFFVQRKDPILVFSVIYAFRRIFKFFFVEKMRFY